MHYFALIIIFYHVKIACYHQGGVRDVRLEPKGNAGEVGNRQTGSRTEFGGFKGGDRLECAVGRIPRRGGAWLISRQVGVCVIEFREG